MRAELKDFHKSISNSRKRAENELHSLQIIEGLIQDSESAEWVKVSPQLKKGLFLARLPGEGMDGRDLIFVADNTILWGLREYPTSNSEDSIFDFFSLDKLEILV